MARFLRTDTNSSGGHSRLRGPEPPIVTPAGAPFVATPIRVQFADVEDRSVHNQRQRRTTSLLAPPAVVGAGIAFHGPGVRLADPLSPNSLSRRQSKARLAPPTVITQTATFVASPIRVQLTDIEDRGAHNQKQRKSKSFLRAPVVVQIAFVARPTLVKLAPSTRLARAPRSVLPRVVYAARVYEPISGYLTKPLDTVPATLSFLRPPVAVTEVVTETYYGPSVTLAPSKFGKPKSRLLSVPDAFQPFRPAITRLAYAPTKAKAKPRLSAPAVVDLVLARATDVALAPQKRGIPHSVLRPPVVVGPVLASPVDVTLARIRPVRTNPVLRRPADLVDSADLGLARVHLAYSLRGKPKSILRKPVVVAPVLAKAIDVTLAPQKRGVPHSALRPPVVVAPVLARPIDTTLVRIRPFLIHSVLRRPVDLVDQQDVGALRAHLAYSVRGRPKSILRLPIVVAPVLARPIDVTLTRILPSAVHPILRRPVDLVDSADLGAVRTRLAYSIRGVPKSHLGTPTVIAPVLAPPILVAAAPSSRGIPKSKLSAPVVVQAFRIPVISVSLAPSLRGRPLSGLGKSPSVLQPETGQMGGTLTSLARPPVQARWAHSRLSPPVVVGASVGVAETPSVTIVRIRPRRTMAVVRPPVVAPSFASPIRIRVVRIRPRDTIATLGRPTVVFPFLAKTTDVTLARIRPAVTHAALRRPTDLVDTQDLGLVAIALAYSLRGKPKSKLLPPTVVAPVLARPVDTTFAPQKRGVPKSILRVPTVVIQFFARPVSVRLAPSSQGKSKPFFLRAPVVGSGIAFHGPGVRLTNPLSSPPAVHSVLREPAFVDLSPQAYYLGLNLAYSRRGASKSLLTQASLFVPQPKAETTLVVTLAYTSRGKPKSFLGRPTDLIDTQDLGFVKVHLAYSLRGKAKPRLSPPAEVAPVLARQIVVRLVRILPTPVHSTLRRPADLVDQVAFVATPVRMRLTYSVRGKTMSVLPLVVLAARVYEPIAGFLTGPRDTVPTSRSILGRPIDVADRQDVRALDTTFARITPPPVHSVLRKPVVIAASPQPILSVSLAPSRQPHPKSFLRAPVVITSATPYLRPIDTTLARIKPVATETVLRRPVVVFPRVLGRITDVTLARIRPAVVHSSLKRPTDLVDAQDFGFIHIRLAYQSRRLGRALLSPPIVIDPTPQTQFVATTFAYSSRGNPTSLLRSPSVVQTPPSDAFTRTTLVSIRPPAVHSILRAPAVIGAGIYFRGLLIQLAPSFRGIPKSRLTNTTLFISQEGIVCSEVLDLSEVCGDTTDLSGILQGAVLDEDVADGGDIAESTATGEDLDMYHADGEVL